MFAHFCARTSVIALIYLCATTIAAVLGWGSTTAQAASTASGASAPSFAPQCVDPNFPAARDAANPLMLDPAPTDGDVLQGAPLFVAGPARGPAAGAIAQLLGYGRGQALSQGQPLANFPDSLSWARFARFVALKLPGEPSGVRRQIRLLEKIAREPAPLRISAFSGGGSPAAIYTQTRKLLCTILKADPHTIPIITTYFLHPELGGCATAAAIESDGARFGAQIAAMAQAIGRRPVILFLELDAVGSSSCMAAQGSLGPWEALLKYEARTFEALPHTAVYLEGGYSDSNSAAYAARILNRSGVRQVQGFYTNDTHLQWTAHELRYARAISTRTGAAHFVINTSGNGRGPLLNAHPASEGVEDLCNPPRRGLGIPDSTDPGLDSRLDGLLWIVPPGNSSGSCNGGPAGGSFWIARAESLAANANDQLGPGTPSRPY